MATQRTAADSLQWYLSGATSDGGSQSDPDSALGNYRSSSKIVSLEPTANPITLGSSSLTIERICDTLGEGTGTLTAVDANSCTWTPPSGSAGATVTISNGETKMIPGNAPDRFIVITRNDSNSFSGSQNVEYNRKYPNFWGFRDITPSERTAGVTLYRAAFIKNESAATVQSVKVRHNPLGTQRTSDSAQLPASGAGTITCSTGGAFDDWPEKGFCLIKDSGGTLREVVYYSSRTATSLTVPALGRAALSTTAAAGAATDTIRPIAGMRLAKEAPASQPSGNIQTIASETTAPTSVSWSIPCADSEAISIGDLSPGYIYGLWLELDLPAGVDAEQFAEAEIAILANAA